jgi:hypothetical protein
MEHAVVYFTAKDESSALMVSDELGKCATYCRNGDNASVHPDWQHAKHLVVIGGAFNISHPNAEDCCGAGAPETAIKSAQYVQRLRQGK